MGHKESNQTNYLCEDGIEKFVPHDHRLSSLGRPHDGNRWSSGQIFFYPTLTVMTVSCFSPSPANIFCPEIVLFFLRLLPFI